MGTMLQDFDCTSIDFANLPSSITFDSDTVLEHTLCSSWFTTEDTMDLVATDGVGYQGIVTHGPGIAWYYNWMACILSVVVIYVAFRRKGELLQDV